MNEWSPDDSLATRLYYFYKAAEKMRTDSIFLGQLLSYQKIKSFISEVLLIDIDFIEIEKINCSIKKSLSLPLNLPDYISPKERILINADSYSLSKFMGVDPFRLATLSFSNSAGKSLVRKDKQKIHAKFLKNLKDAQDSKLRLDVDIHIDKNVTWRNGTLTIKNQQWPPSVLMSLNGKKVSEIIDHPWPGWENIAIISGFQKGKSLVLKTDSKREINLIQESGIPDREHHG